MYEPNDERTRAAQLQPGIHKELALIAGEQDWYYVAVDSHYTVTITLHYPQEKTDSANGLYMRVIRDSDARQYYSTNYTHMRFSTPDTLIMSGTAADTLRVLIDAYGTIDSLYYTMSIEQRRRRAVRDTGENDRFEPNDTRANAVTIQAGVYDSLRIVAPGDSDWYALELPAGKRTIDVSIECRGTAAQKVHAALYRDSSGTRLAHEYGSDPLAISYTSQAPATYYVLVLPYSYEMTVVNGDTSGNRIPYTMDVAITTQIDNDRFESNDTIATAATLQPGHYTGLNASNYDDDWYEITIDSAGHTALTLDYTPYEVFSYITAHLGLTLYDSTGSYITFAQGTGTKRLYRVTETPGTYYVQVSASRKTLDHVFSYSLSYEHIATAALDDRYEDNDTAHHAAPLPAFGRYDSLALVADDKDYYRITLPDTAGTTSVIFTPARIADLSTIDVSVIDRGSAVIYGTSLRTRFVTMQRDSVVIAVSRFEPGTWDSADAVVAYSLETTFSPFAAVDDR
jgi:hypothetical protein